MKISTLCYIENGDEYLMLHRTKKENDENRDKWIGIGGKLENGESPHEGIRREAMEEVGITLSALRYRGLITFVSDIYGTEYMHLFTALYDGQEINYDCSEGEVCFVKKSEIEKLPIWQGDKIFLDLLVNEERFFSLKLVYQADTLISHTLEF